MNSSRVRLLLATLVTVASFAQPRSVIPVVDVQRRVALVIGNAAYRTAPLVNPGNDANAMDQALRSVGFEVRKLVDLDQAALDQAVDDFVKGLRAGDLALFYFSGHGLQIDRENFLLPVDFAASNESDAKRASLSADGLQERLERGPARVRVLVLDACRNNPFRSTRGLGGLSAMASSTEGTVISFATTGNGVADDNRQGSNGLFTKHLLESLTAPGVGLREVFVRTRAQVYAASANKQLPSVYESLVGDLVLRDPALELARLRIENAQLEAERVKLEERARKARTEQERRDAERQAAEKEALLRIRRAEEDRRKEEEASRLARVQAEAEVLARLRKERQAEADRNEELRRNVSAGRAGMEEVITLDVARREVAALERQIEQIRNTVGEGSAPWRDEFESTAAYNARVTAARDEKEARVAELTKESQARIADWKKRRYPVLGAKLIYKSYDADKGLFTVEGPGSAEYQAKVSPEDARILKESLELGTIESPFAGEREPLRSVTLLHGRDRREYEFRLPPEPGDKWVNPADGLTYAWIPPGSFQTDDRKRITLTRGFWLTDSEITQEAYRKVIGKSPSHFKGGDLPVENVNWDEASAYCAKIGGRLPTEAEWEHAARAGTGKDVYGAVDKIAWYDGNSGKTTHPVRTKEPSAWGLYDMLGNVWEWTADWHARDQAVGADPKGPATGSERVIRGGSWNYFSTYARASSRYGWGPSDRVDVIGFRCARE